jgi:hypothetical protein
MKAGATTELVEAAGTLTAQRPAIAGAGRSPAPASTCQTKKVLLSTNHLQADSPCQSLALFQAITVLPNQRSTTSSLSCGRLRIRYLVDITSELALPVGSEHGGQRPGLVILHPPLQLHVHATKSPSPYRSFVICESKSERQSIPPVQVASVHRGIYKIRQEAWRNCVGHNVTFEVTCSHVPLWISS